MSSPNHPTSDIEDVFSSNFPDYIPDSPDYFPASPGNTSSESSNNSSGLVPIALPTLSLFYNDPYMKIPLPKDTKTPVESPIPISSSSSVGSSSSIRSTTPPPDNLFDESIFAELDNSLWIIPRRPLGEEPVLEESNELDACQKMPPKKTSTSETPAITLAAIQQLIANGIAAALEAQTTTMASASNPNRNTRLTGTPVAKMGNYKDSLAVNLSTSMVRKEQLASFTGLSGLNRYFLVATVPRKTKWHLLPVP
ncbi:hypothetical protein Tco_1258790 [Tanacetum coccineum]